AVLARRNVSPVSRRNPTPPSPSVRHSAWPPATSWSMKLTTSNPAGSRWMAPAWAPGRPRRLPSSGLLRGFTIDQGALALDTPGISRERTVIADHAMARNGHGELVGRARLRDGAGRLRRSDASRDFGVADRRTDGDLSQRLPDALLKCRAA